MTRRPVRFHLRLPPRNVLADLLGVLSDDEEGRPRRRSSVRSQVGHGVGA
ncbi:hypothetical protein [Frankia sp. Cas3]|nr:hypothetical protein [Frankia sp. Cas3]